MTRKLFSLILIFWGSVPWGLVAAEAWPLYLKGAITGLSYDTKSLSFQFSGKIELSFTLEGDFITAGKKQTTILQEVSDIPIHLRDMAISDPEQNAKMLEEMAKLLLTVKDGQPVTFFLIDPSIKLKEEGRIAAVTAPWLHFNDRRTVRSGVNPSGSESQLQSPRERPAPVRRIVIPSQPAE